MWDGAPDDTNPIDEKEVTLRIFRRNSRDRALNLRRRLELYNSPYILKCLMFGGWTNDSTAVVCQRIPGTNIANWIATQQVGDLWIQNNRTNEYVAGTELFLRVFRGVLSGLDAFIQREGFYGRCLSKNVYVSSNGEDVKLVEPYLKVIAGPQVDWLKADIRSFCRLVGRAAGLMGPQPLFIQLFIDLIQGVLPNLHSFAEVRDFFYFVKSHPIFYDSSRRYYFVRRISRMAVDINISRLICGASITLKAGLTDLSGWHGHITHTADPGLYEVLIGTAGLPNQPAIGTPQFLAVKNEYTKSTGVIHYQSCAYEHVTTLVKRRQKPMLEKYLEIERRLFALLPHFVGKAFHELACYCFDGKNPVGDRAMLIQELGCIPYLLGS